MKSLIAAAGTLVAAAALAGVVAAPAAANTYCGTYTNKSATWQSIKNGETTSDSQGTATCDGIPVMWGAPQNAWWDQLITSLNGDDD